MVVRALRQTSFFLAPKLKEHVRFEFHLWILSLCVNFHFSVFFVDLAKIVVIDHLGILFVLKCQPYTLDSAEILVAMLRKSSIVMTTALAARMLGRGQIHALL